MGGDSDLHTLLQYLSTKLTLAPSQFEFEVTPTRTVRFLFYSTAPNCRDTPLVSTYRRCLRVCFESKVSPEEVPQVS